MHIQIRAPLEMYHGVRTCDKSCSTKAEELRKRVIQESKYLGGDMKHTHLVKGLDYALLQKVNLLLNGHFVIVHWLL